VPQVILTEPAAADLDRCRLFLFEQDREGSRRAALEIDRRLRLLATSPDGGRAYSDDESLRELTIAFGRTGYVVLYSHVPREDAVYILAMRHQREVGYRR
jgi:plasmid stabilization system protein ParE